MSSHQRRATPEESWAVFAFPGARFVDFAATRKEARDVIKEDRLKRATPPSTYYIGRRFGNS